MYTIKHINPKNMAPPRGYSHAISLSGNYRTIYIGGQNAVDENGNLVGKDNLKEQTGQVLNNIENILIDANATLENIVKLNIYVMQGQNPVEGFEAFQKRWKNPQNFPTVTVLFVAGLAHPGWLVEIDAVAIVPEEHS